jgi:hypothetical protein
MDNPLSVLNGSEYHVGKIAETLNEDRVPKGHNE